MRIAHTLRRDWRFHMGYGLLFAFAFGIGVVADFCPWFVTVPVGVR